MKCWLGIDCGSVSIKLALVNARGKVVKSTYLRNQGIEKTVEKGLKEIHRADLQIAGVGVTGSGREFLSLLLGADVVKTEILAHTIATLHFYPYVRTVMDIGGEDCKIMTVNGGVLDNFIMNNICASGTGAVIESIATRLGLRIEDVGDVALTSKKKLDISGKCGIFAQSAVVSRLNSGEEKSDIMMGVVRALTNNYLTLARGIEINPPYVFQGATAQNNAVVRALEEHLNHKIIVPKHCAIMGAIGIALMTKEAGITKSKFKGFKLQKLTCRTAKFQCDDCPNLCEVTQLFEGDKLMGAIGSRCGKWNKTVYESATITAL